MELRERVTWARIFPLTDISGSLGRSPPLGGPLVAGQLRGSGTTGGELEEFAGFRLEPQVSVLIAGIIVSTRSGHDAVK